LSKQQFVINGGQSFGDISPSNLLSSSQGGLDDADRDERGSEESLRAAHLFHCVLLERAIEGRPRPQQIVSSAHAPFRFFR